MQPGLVLPASENHLDIRFQLDQFHLTDMLVHALPLLAHKRLIIVSVENFHIIISTFHGLRLPQ